jgi:polyphosphate kinase 2 (PPK2 family)
MNNLSTFLIPTGKFFRFDEFVTNVKQLTPEGTSDGQSGNPDVLSGMQEKLYASDSHAVLLILEGLEGNGMDQVIRNVLTSINPQGCFVKVFHKPSDEELGHSFLWRYLQALPDRGHIGVFKHSYFSEIVPWLLVENIKSESKQTNDSWIKMCEDINAIESHINNHKTKIIKVFIYVSKEEQNKRFLEILDDENERWKFTQVHLSDHLDYEFLHTAWENIIHQTNTHDNPWYVLPGDDLLILESLVCELIIQSITQLGVEYPEIPSDELEKFKESRQRLLTEN